MKKPAFWLVVSFCLAATQAHAYCLKPDGSKLKTLPPGYVSDECLGKFEAFCRAEQQQKSTGEKIYYDQFGLMNEVDADKGKPITERRNCFYPYAGDTLKCDNGRFDKVELSDPSGDNIADQLPYHDRQCAQGLSLRDGIKWNDSKDAEASTQRRDAALAAYLDRATRQCVAGRTTVKLEAVPAKPFGDLSVELHGDSLKFGDLAEFRWDSKLKRWCHDQSAYEMYGADSKEGPFYGKMYKGVGGCEPEFTHEIHQLIGKKVYVVAIAYGSPGKDLKIQPVQQPFPVATSLEGGNSFKKAPGEPIVFSHAGPGAAPLVKGSPSSLSYERIAMSYAGASVTSESPVGRDGVLDTFETKPLPFPAAGQYIAGCFQYGVESLTSTNDGPPAVRDEPQKVVPAK
ncbi:MAG: hypothetical protein HY075_02795 [Deltaproteobacteria bacterium]|nr:hypothetical protein [Deltaproteobacteria bacterium]